MSGPLKLPPLSARQAQYAAELVPLIREQARSTARLVRGAKIDDMIGVGNEAVMGIAIRFEPERGVPLGAYARPRLRWAMLDAAYRARGPEARVLARLAALKKQEPTEVGEREGASLSEIIEGPSPRGLAVARQHEKIASMAAAVFAGAPPDVEQAAIERETYVLGVEALRASLSELEETERRLVQAFWYDGLTIDQVAARLDMNRTAVRRAHARIIKKLDLLLRKRGVRGPVTGEE
jgi:RNA polymerase sigma factor for flagellar operon FliA